MLSWIREKFGTAVIGGIISLIGFVFVFYGVFSPKSTRGLHEGSVAGTVNGEPISISDFSRELNRRLEFYKSMGGGKITDEQIKAFRVREAVLQELTNRKIMIQESHKRGLLASDEEVKEKIREVPAFQKDGKFDLTSYKQVLEANNFTPNSFERQVREDSSLRRWEFYFKDRIQVTEEEVRREFLLTQDRRSLKYVLITPDAVKKTLPVSDADVQKYLADPAKVNLIKLRFDAGKDDAYKGQKFEDAKVSIARSLLLGDKVEEIRNISQKVATEVASLMKVDSGSDKQVNSALKRYGVEVKTTGLLNRTSPSLPGVGDIQEVLKDAFSPVSPIDGKASGKAKKYPVADRILIALVVDSQKPDLAKLPTERNTLIRQISMKKGRDLYQDWMKAVAGKAKVETNTSVVTESM